MTLFSLHEKHKQTTEMEKKFYSEGLKHNPDICQGKHDMSALIIHVQSWAVCCTLFQFCQLSATAKKNKKKNSSIQQKHRNDPEKDVGFK